MENFKWEEAKQYAEDIERNRDHIIKDINIEASDITDYKLRQQYNRMALYAKHLRALDYHTEEAQSLYKTMHDYLTNVPRHLSDAFTEDLKELDICFKNGAYKATLILAGSILEAFLIDWLSEKDGVDYTKTPYRVKVVDKKGNVHMENRDTLLDYINSIEEIEYPEWMESSRKAHFIRKNRNIVHAKICLRSELPINEETCRTVMSYLEEIITARLNKMKACL